jgi:uncharacterized protein
MKIQEQFIQFIQHADFPCIGARAAAKKKQLYFFIGEDLRSNQNDTAIVNHVYQFIKLTENALKTCIIIFKEPYNLSEKEFEGYLWQRLQALHHLDSIHHLWDPSVNSDVTHNNFSFSLGGQAFFIVGMHPHSSRKARQFTYPTLVFNLHEQFEQLKQENHYETMKNKIRENELEFCGSINPMLKDFGTQSEAVQYSGRTVEDNFCCPFKTSSSP